MSNALLRFLARSPNGWSPTKDRKAVEAEAYERAAAVADGYAAIARSRMRALNAQADPDQYRQAAMAFEIANNLAFSIRSLK